MCGQHRDDHGIGKESEKAFARDTGVSSAGEREGHGALAWRRVAQGMGTGTADVVLVLRDIGEMREIAEGADDLKRFPRRQIVQSGFQVATRGNILVATEADRILANILNGFENLLAILLAYRVAKDPAEQPDVVSQRLVLVFGVDCVRIWHGSPFHRDPRRMLSHICRNRASPKESPITDPRRSV